MVEPERPSERPGWYNPMEQKGIPGLAGGHCCNAEYFARMRGVGLGVVEASEGACADEIDAELKRA